MPVGSINSLQDTLGPTLAGLDQQAARLRTGNADRLKQIVADRVAASKGLSESLAAQGLSHSSVHLDRQAKLAQDTERRTFEEDQRFTDRLNNLAKRRIDAEAQFNFNNVLPR